MFKVRDTSLKPGLYLETCINPRQQRASSRDYHVQMQRPIQVGVFKWPKRSSSSMTIRLSVRLIQAVLEREGFAVAHAEERRRRRSPA